ncbi:hypothetical protein CXF68_09025 [Tenacibaculum sp. Bg11-29]|uniref:DUF7151 family protein n=1 Tax=Tenacibaculum sp. Bg11-29 TaxID=2058306 RepID=UPI000C3348C1|nr:hypothetical protein [Tenacibaculum sp. Bg11-29]PKH50820.1 hypothetical protein CXF68_09025 [Tenacibaculum sp. Bg11-29]
MKHFTKEKLYYLLIVIFIVSCEGEDGQIGSIGEQGESGINSLIKTSNEDAGENCENGGLKIETGLDINSNGILEENEIQSTNYTCNGVDGYSSLVKITEESDGANCKNGGIKINSGIDSNKNGILDEIEIDTTEYICNGIGGIGEVVLDFNYSFSNGTNSSDGKVSDSFKINNFNIENYNNFDFAKFSASIRSSDSSASCIIELYDFTSETVISEAIIQTNETSSTFIETTVNFFNELPTSSTNLGIKIKSSVEGIDVWCSNPRLILSKK